MHVERPDNGGRSRNMGAGAGAGGCGRFNWTIAIAIASRPLLELAGGGVAPCGAFLTAIGMRLPCLICGFGGSKRTATRVLARTRPGICGMAALRLAPSEVRFWTSVPKPPFGD